MVFNQTVPMPPLGQHSNGHFRDRHALYLLACSEVFSLLLLLDLGLEKMEDKRTYEQVEREGHGMCVASKEANLLSMVPLMKEEMQHINPTAKLQTNPTANPIAKLMNCP